MRCPYDSHPVFCEPTKKRKQAWCVPVAKDLSTRSGVFRRSADAYCNSTAADIERELGTKPAKKKPLEALLQHLVQATAEAYVVHGENAMMPRQRAILDAALKVAESVRHMTENRPLDQEKMQSLKIVVRKLEELPTSKRDIASSAADIVTTLAIVTQLLSGEIINAEQEYGEDAQETHDDSGYSKLLHSIGESVKDSLDFAKSAAKPNDNNAPISAPASESSVEDLRYSVGESAKESVSDMRLRKNFMDQRTTDILAQIKYYIKVLDHFDYRLDELKSMLPRKDYVNFSIAIRNTIKLLQSIDIMLQTYERI